MDKIDRPIVIIYPNMRYNIDLVIEISQLWKCDEINVYAVEDFDKEYGKNEYEPCGMPHGLEKLQIVIKHRLIELGAIIDPNEEIIDESSSSSDESGYDAECWVLKFSIETKKEKKLKHSEPHVTKFTLTYFYDIDAFDGDWPEMEPADILIHTNGPLDPEIVAETVENPYEVDVYGTREMLRDVWGDKGEIETIDDNSDLCLFGNLGDYIAGVDESSSDS
jgi:hypothetical protein